MFLFPMHWYEEKVVWCMKVFNPELPQFFTATNLWWKPLLKIDAHKDIIIDSLRFLVKDNRILLYAFVLMPNHIHLIWRIKQPHTPSDVQRDFLRFTGHQFQKYLRNHNPGFLEHFRVNDADRKYQLWERNPFSRGLNSAYIFNQKLNYLHMNPVKKGFCKKPEDYQYSSAKFYLTGIDNWGFLEKYHI